MTLVVKKMLANTLKELMNEKPLTKITVQDLTKKCGISRQTFYNHFHDIYELVEWIYLNEAHITLGENISYENWQDALEALFQYMDDVSFCQQGKCRATLATGSGAFLDGFDFQ